MKNYTLNSIYYTTQSYLVTTITCLALLNYSTIVHAYSGREVNANWRAAADARIESHRKADLNIRIIRSDGSPYSGIPIRVSMKKHQFGFGSAVSAKRIADSGVNEEHYKSIIEQNFNKVVFENDLKWDQWEKGKQKLNTSQYNSDKLQNAFIWLKDRNIKIRGHYLLWGPLEKLSEYSANATDPIAFKKLLIKHLNDEILKVGDLVEEWDFINHPIGWDRKLVMLHDFLNYSIYNEVESLVRSYTPNIRLVINEGRIIPSVYDADNQRRNYINFIEKLRKQGIKIDSIGFMSHFSNNTLTPPDQVLNILDRFSKIGLPLQITEFDISFGKKGEPYQMSNEELSLQADYTRDFMTIAFSHPKVESFIIWGFWEGQQNAPRGALINKDWTVKPNGIVFFDLIRKHWWTDTEGKSDSAGRYATRGFKGDYEITVGTGSKAYIQSEKLVSDKEITIVYDK